MRRKEWFELHDQSWFPEFLRDFVTEGLQVIWDSSNSYRVIVPRFREALEKANTHSIVDMCSGAGGPWFRLKAELLQKEGFPIQVVLTDLYPNRPAFERARQKGIDVIMESVDAQRIPEKLKGFRTIFSSFHHFSPARARAILADPVAQRRGIGIFEVVKPDARTLCLVTLTPLLCLFLTPRLRPFRWSRLFWTYLLPVIPLTLLIDGILSCMRSYSQDDLRELTEGLGGDGYHWETGEERGGKAHITYLIGWPVEEASPLQ